MSKIQKKIFVRREGNSNVISIPASMCLLAGIEAGSVLRAEQEKNVITLTALEVESKN